MLNKELRYKDKTANCCRFSKNQLFLFILNEFKNK